MRSAKCAPIHFALRAPHLALLFLLAAPLAAQEPAALPDEVADAVVDFVNDPRRARLAGPADLPADSTIRGDVAVLGGPLTLAGRVEGSVVVVNGDVELRPGGSVGGDLLVVGGAVRGAEEARVAGEVLAYAQPLHYRREGARLVRERPHLALSGTGVALSGEPAWGRSDFLITSGKSYNRVEGLPITFGPRIETEGSNPLRVLALAVYRTESGLTLDTRRMGYFVRAEQFVGGWRALRLGLTAHSVVDPVEDWHLTDLESGLATFLFHQDFRDHYEREGGSGFVTWEPLGSPLSLTAELRWERHRSLAPGSPWSVLDNGDGWRLQPLVGEGKAGIASVQASYDTRSHAADPATGWHLWARVEQAVHSRLERPALLDLPPDPVSAAPLPPGEPFGLFRRASVDLRRYNRVDPVSRLNFRLVAGGALDGDALPPQFQYALGGPGSLPGYPLFSRDCGARGATGYRATDPAGRDAAPFYGAYGCDAFALLQAEFRGKLSFRFRWDGAPWRDDEEEEGGWGFGWDFAPDWAFFVDAGRAWGYDGRPDEPVAVDAGVGVLVERFGIYFATPLSGGRGINVFVRLGPRF